MRGCCLSSSRHMREESLHSLSEGVEDDSAYVEVQTHTNGISGNENFTRVIGVVKPRCLS